jgi:hypothetical protein
MKSREFAAIRRAGGRVKINSSGCCDVRSRFDGLAKPEMNNCVKR